MFEWSSWGMRAGQDSNLKRGFLVGLTLLRAPAQWWFCCGGLKVSIGKRVEPQTRQRLRLFCG